MIFDTLIKKLKRSMQEDDISHLCQQYCDYIGFDYFVLFGTVFHTLINPPSSTLSNMTTSIRSHQVDIDLLIKERIKHSTPVVSAQLDKSSPLHSFIPNPDPILIDNHISISFPVHFPSGRYALFHLLTETEGEEYNDLIMDVLVSGNIFAREAGTAIIRTLEYNLDNEPLYLSQREKECLLLASDGLNPKTIATELGLSTHTVMFHLKKSRKKLDCKNLQGAISKAMMSGDVTAALDTERT
ncbi:MAG: LuxR family transcriptional regulator [Gammaproteobacteria bacterium]|nr:LuxR family transcriptional regulator [Gammaproteobacteria bacterium]